jgi:hypothetical protein
VEPLSRHRCPRQAALLQGRVGPHIAKEPAHCRRAPQGEPMVSLLHFDTRSKHAGHYLGSTCDLEARLALHATGRGALAARRACRWHHLAPGAHLAWWHSERTPAHEATRRQPLLPHLQGGTPCSSLLDIPTVASGPSMRTASSCA